MTRSGKRRRSSHTEEDSPKQKIKQQKKMSKNPSLADIAKMLDENKKHLENVINTKFDEANSKMEALTGNLIRQINSLETSHQTLTVRVDKQEDELARICKLTELRINGIPWKSDENLNDIFVKISNKIQFDVSNKINLPFLSRINKSTADSMKRNGTIIAQFVAPHIKRMFYGCYLKNLSLNLKDIEFQSDTRIIISENLTKINKIIFDEAYKMKREKTIQQVFTVNGSVHIRIQNDKPAILINSLNNLKQIVESSKSTKEQNTNDG